MNISGQIRAAMTDTHIVARRRPKNEKPDGEQKFRALFENTGVGMALLDETGGLVNTNVMIRRARTPYRTVNSLRG